MATVLGVGGIFFKSQDPERLSQWYKQRLGLPIEQEAGATFAALQPYWPAKGGRECACSSALAAYGGK